jgi:hypothetical protein
MRRNSPASRTICPAIVTTRSSAVHKGGRLAPSQGEQANAQVGRVAGRSDGHHRGRLFAANELRQQIDRHRVVEPRVGALRLDDAADHPQQLAVGRDHRSAGRARVAGDRVVEQHVAGIRKVLQAPAGVELHSEAEYANIDRKRFVTAGHLKSITYGENPVPRLGRRHLRKVEIVGCGRFDLQQRRLQFLAAAYHGGRMRRAVGERHTERLTRQMHAVGRQDFPRGRNGQARAIGRAASDPRTVDLDRPLLGNRDRIGEGAVDAAGTRLLRRDGRYSGRQVQSQRRRQPTRTHDCVLHRYGTGLANRSLDTSVSMRASRVTIDRSGCSARPRTNVRRVGSIRPSSG